MSKQRLGKAQSLFRWCTAGLGLCVSKDHTVIALGFHLVRASTPQDYINVYIYSVSLWFHFYTCRSLISFSLVWYMAWSAFLFYFSLNGWPIWRHHMLSNYPLSPPWAGNITFAICSLRFLILLVYFTFHWFLCQKHSFNYCRFIRLFI